MTEQEQHSHSRDAYDLVVIGGGPAGEKGAAQAAYFGKRVAIVERARIGGAVTNTGTLPSKTLQATAAHIAEMRDRDELDMEFRLNEDITVDDLFRRQREVVRAHLGVVNQNIRRHNIDLIDGAAVLRDAHTVEVTCTGGPPRVLDARYILIATGSRPSKPEEIPFDGEHVYDSDSILQMRRIPRSMVVVGAGAIGCEYASLFAAVGVRVTLVDSRERLLPFIDHELTAVLEAQMRARGVNVLYRQRVVGVEVHAAEDRVEVLLKDGYTLSAESLLFVAGRSANTHDLGLVEAGVAIGTHGTIAVDDHYRTSLPGVYAAGDVIGFPALASTSMEQARVAVCHAFGFDYKRQVSSLIPYGLFTIPPISTVGASEEDLIARGEPYLVGRTAYRTNARGQILGDATGLVKLLFSPRDRRLLGVGIVGEGASELIHLGQACMHFEGTIDFFIESVFNFPTLSDAYKYAAYDGLGKLQDS